MSTEEPKKTGRPPKEISAEAVLNMARLGAKVTTIAKVFGVSTDTLYRRFAAELNQGDGEGELAVLSKLYEQGVTKGNPMLLKFIAENRVGYSSKTEAKTEHNISVTPQLTVDEVAGFLETKTA